MRKSGVLGQLTRGLASDGGVDGGASASLGQVSALVGKELMGMAMVDGIGTAGHGRKGGSSVSSLHFCVVFFALRIYRVNQNRIVKRMPAE